VFGAPQIEDAEIDEVAEVLRSGWLGTGPRVAELERRFAAYKGAAHAAALNSCTAALHLSLLTLDLNPGDEVITTALTFCATVNAIIHAGATPVLADIDPVTLNIDPTAIEAAITARTRAILLVHFAGRPCDMDRILNLAEKHELHVIEDCAHAVETEYRGNKAGTMGSLGCFSFYVTKNMTTGEGGMVITRDEHKINRIKILGLHGMSRDAWHRFGDKGYRHYQVIEAGFKYNMTDIQAAIGLHQLDRLEDNWRRRQEIWLHYTDALGGLPLTLPVAPEPETRHGLHLFTLLVGEDTSGVARDRFLDAMNARKIGTGVHYQSIADHPFYQSNFNWRPEQWPHAMSVGRRTVSIPLSAALTDGDVEDVVSAVRDVVGANAPRRSYARVAGSQRG
jgi:dTDP-4-amino-4,6-dideoxygalactose transaminase